MYADYVLSVKRYAGETGFYVEFSQTALSCDWELGVALWSNGSYYMMPINASAVLFEQNPYSGIDSMAAIKGTQHFNANPLRPNCLYIDFIGNDNGPTNFSIGYFSRNYNSSETAVFFTYSIEDIV